MNQPRRTWGRRRLAALAGGLLALGYAASAPAADITTGLKAYWNFDEQNFKDAVGIYDGTENGDSPIDFVAGKAGFGQAIQLLGPTDSGGANQYVEITGGEPDDLAFADGSMSLSVWFRVDAWDKSWQALVAKGEGGNWRIHRRGTENVMGYTGGAAGDTPSGTKDVNDGQWHHLVAIKDADADTSYLWIDGVQDATREAIGTLASNGLRMMIGENPAARNRYWHGLIDDVAVWDRPLTATEIASLWSNGAGKALSTFFTPLVDTDNDGMPDEWEQQYAACCALNPNDASDAAKDCNGNGISNLDEYKRGLDPCNTTRPTIVSAVSTASFNTVVLTFSEALDPATATVAANYTISPALAVTAATYRNKVVTLTTAAQTPGGTAYTVTVKGVKNLSNWEPAEGSNTATFYTYIMTRNGVLKFSYWGGITGTPVANLEADLRYPASPDWTGAVHSINSRDILPDDSRDNYGATIEGYLTPTESGDYDFFLRSDDASQLWISTDATEANLVWQAEEYGCCAAFLEPNDATKPTVTTSLPVSLVANRRYFIRVIYKEGGGGDYAQVAWRKVGDPTPAGSLLPIPGRYLSAAVDLPAPAEGAYVTRTPGPDAKNVLPDVRVTIAHRDGKVEWTAANTSLKFDDVTVTPTFTKDGNVATLTYKPSGLLASKSVHTITLGHPDPAGQPTTTQWSFEVAEYRGPVVDKVNAYPAILLGAAKQTEAGGGRTGAAGDLALDAGVAAGVGYVADATFLNAATADDTLTIAFFQKLRSVRASSSFWANSPSSNNGTRGYQAHVPWSDSTIYFDTSGCCGADTQRINAPIANFPEYTGDASWWQQWRHFAFVKAGPEKFIYINGQLFHAGFGDPLKTDFTTLLMGGGPSNTDNRMDGFLDDFVIYNGALTEAQARSLSTGAAPSSIAGLIAHWDFNDQPPATVTLKAARSGANVTITSEPAALPAGWVLQTAPSVNGPWTTQAGATTPLTVPIGAANAFVRAARP
ncbi:MAG: Ig-like domain-containing protein [Verrucomicrobiales bacterium]|nr:Ig-like domain-containing protein [Verrucomicrobiales bacterium]